MKKILISIVTVLAVGIGLFGGYKLYLKQTSTGKLIGNLRFPANLQTIYDAHASTTSGNKLGVVEYRTIVCSVVGHSAPTATIKFAGSISEDTPNFDVTQSVTNTWDYVEIVDTQNGATIDGDTGISFTGSSISFSFIK